MSPVSPIVGIGTFLAGGVVIAINRKTVAVKRSRGESFVIVQIPHSEVEKLVS